MILLKRVRLINWYGFSNVTAPIGFFTLIAGKNGNGKSVMLDAIKYAAFGDTIFNKSSESKGSRTLSSYTRGLLDATAGTYMRPADRVPNVYSHIVQEYYDDVEEKAFILGAVIETNAANNCQTLRYVMDKTSLEEVEHLYEKDGVKLPYSASQLQKKYGVSLLLREPGLQKFMQMTGLKLNMNQVNAYLRKLRGIMSYDPNAKIDRFIRESVLEERSVDFTKLIEAKGNIERLNETFSVIQEEIAELEKILNEYDTLESEKNRLLADDIKIIYRKMKQFGAVIEEQIREQKLASGKKEELSRTLEALGRREEENSQRLIQARISLNQLDSTKMIQEEEKRLDSLKEEKRLLALEKDSLEQFQVKVSEILHAFMEEGRSLEEKEILASLCDSAYAAFEKERAVDWLKQAVSDSYDEFTEQGALVGQEIEGLNRKLAQQERILEEAGKRRNTYDQIPEYVGLKEEINREFAKRKLPAEAKFACEYVIDLSDEAWRDALEAFLGIRSYTILVDPQYYDIADDVLNRSSYKYAHLFNTKLLMKKELEPEKDSAVHLLKIKNAVAKKYFDFQLGRMHAVKLEEVRNYENAISVEGRVSVAMDSYFLRFDRIRSYYLGQETFELNRRRAEREIAKLQAERREKYARKEAIEDRKSRLKQDREFFKPYDFDVHEKYQKTAKALEESDKQLKKLKRAQENNKKYLELSQLVSQLADVQEAIKEEQKDVLNEISRLETRIQLCENTIETKSAELDKEKEQFREYEISSYTVVQKAVEAYEKYEEAGKTGPGGIIAAETRGRLTRSIEQHRKELIGLQSGYNARHPEGSVPIGESDRDVYARRKDRIWMDDLQEIREKMDAQTKRYEDIFKNEFVLTILKTCDKAQDDLKQINAELAKLNFSTRYQFDVHYVKDGSEYTKIIEYAKYLDEREKLGSTSGQMTFDMLTSVSEEEGEQLERELKQIINRIIEKNSEETIARFADYRNYMTYEILMSNHILDRAKLSRQTGFNSGAEVQIPYLLILSSALLMIYNQKVNSTRLVFIDEPFAKMDPGNVKQMLDFMKKQNLQVIFCAPDKTESIGNACEVILPVLRVRPDNMQLGIVQFHEDKSYA
ncbi:MAG: SbcC/MukB-like Walker B domain-containing protein [Lachnospiraceae bacterium]|nr:SbcC/MukB-like Walker B domain-containing protein [Lachnospiraceae bacterium]